MPSRRQTPPAALGIRHVALRVRDLAGAERFYTEILGYAVEWRPDPKNVYLTSGADNLALHWAPRLANRAGTASLDHFGILLGSPRDVDAWAHHLTAQGWPLAASPKTHRDGARSFYACDPEGNRIQFLYHPPISSKTRPRRGASN